MLITVNKTTTPDHFYLWITATIKNYDKSILKKDVKFWLDYNVKNVLGIFSVSQETEEENTYEDKRERVYEKI